MKSALVVSVVLLLGGCVTGNPYEYDPNQSRILVVPTAPELVHQNSMPLRRVVPNWWSTGTHYKNGRQVRTR